ncbi:Transcription factor TFIIIB component B [Onygenales sp. PD_10]|nr:Transcription factor TFIIIB component B [Onygenales sp. PD_10]
MVSFSSSVINKSGKKFAPKAPIRRAGAASAGPASARASADRQASQTPQPAPASSISEPAPPAPAALPAITTPPPTQPPAPHQEPQQQQPPRPKSPPPALVPKPKPKSTAIPIPAPRRRPSIPSVPHPPPAASAPVPSETPAVARPPKAAPSELTTQSRTNQLPSITQPGPGPVEAPPQTTPESPKRPRVEQPADTRPAKRTKISVPVAKPTPSQSQEPPRIEATPTPTPDESEPAQPARSDAAPAAPKRATKKTAKTTARRKRSAEDVADDIVAAAVGEKKPRARRKRQPTPEDAESIEIAPTVVKMSDLCRDLRTGKKSKREMELQSMDSSELARKQKEREERVKNGSKTPKSGSVDPRTADEERDRAAAASLGGPQMRIVNGEIVVDTASLQIDRHADAARNAGDMEEVEENPLTKRINAASFGKRTKIESWDEEMTDLFYRGLRMFGTDFMMISKMFPGRSRRQIKLKFSNEERRYPERIKETLLGPREAVDLETYSEMTNTVYDDPRIIQQELDDEKKRIEDEHAKEKEAREELMRNPNGSTAAGPSDSNVLPSIENGGSGVKGRKKGMGAKKFGGGTEEILGTIDDIAVSA